MLVTPLMILLYVLTSLLAKKWLLIFDNAGTYDLQPRCLLLTYSQYRTGSHSQGLLAYGSVWSHLDHFEEVPQF
jgi:hypothetical protein